MKFIRILTNTLSIMTRKTSLRYKHFIVFMNHFDDKFGETVQPFILDEMKDFTLKSHNLIFKILFCGI